MKGKEVVKFIDLFCGLGGFHVAAKIAGQAMGIKPLCVFASDIDPNAQKIYEVNFGIKPAGDITLIKEQDIPDHDILFAGFPCQAFSICGKQKGFDDTRGTLFFDVARILKEKHPTTFVLENVKQLYTHNQGKTLHTIIETLQTIGYHTHYKILNAMHFGLPQKRERIFIVGFREPYSYNWPIGNIPMLPLSKILETNVPKSYYTSNKIRNKRINSITTKQLPAEITIWHENKSGNINPLPYSCTLRANASYNYLLVNGERRLTEREMLRLQGFPDSYKITCNYSIMRKLVGNSVAIPCVTSIITSVLTTLTHKPNTQYLTTTPPTQNTLFAL